MREARNDGHPDLIRADRKMGIRRDEEVMEKSSIYQNLFSSLNIHYTYLISDIVNVPGVDLNCTTSRGAGG
jgi:hypothetical protein